jgi:type VI secretion system protein ImpH
MARTDRPAAHTLELICALESEPYRFDFYALLRLWECAHKDKPRLGASLRPADDPIRLAQDPSLAFAPAALHSFRAGKDMQPPRVGVEFFGLFGPQGPLPLHLTEYARERMRNVNDPTFVRFLDIFHHRLLSLFYRAWAAAQPTASLDRPDSDRFAVYVASLFGLGMPSLRRRDAIPDLAKLHYAGLLAPQVRGAAALRAILSDFFKLPVRVSEFVGHWMRLPRESRTQLGRSRENASLGRSAIVGARIWDRQHKFRIVIGPVALKDYRRLLPGGDSLRRLAVWVRNYAGDELAWDLQLALEQREVPRLALGKQGQLGWTTWIFARPFGRDAADLILDPHTRAVA